MDWAETTWAELIEKMREKIEKMNDRFLKKTSRRALALTVTISVSRLQKTYQFWL